MVASFIATVAAGTVGHTCTARTIVVRVRTRWLDDACYTMPTGRSMANARPPRVLPLSIKQSIRRKALRRRVEAKMPMFAEDAITKAFDQNPDYYGGVRP
jgi:hypothetical protein